MATACTCGMVMALVTSAGLSVSAAMGAPDDRHKIPTPPPRQAAKPAQTAQPFQPARPSAPAAGAPSQGGQTIKTNVMGKPVEMTPKDAASFKAWQERIQRIAGRGNYGNTPRIDGSMGETKTRDYAIALGDGSQTGVVVVPEHVQVGTWFAGKTRTDQQAGAPAAQGASAPSPVSQILGNANTSVDQLQKVAPVSMTEDAVKEAQAKHPASEGWKEVWLPDGGKVFLKGADPCETQSIADALKQARNPDTIKPFAEDAARAATVDDYVRGVRGDRDDSVDRHSQVGGAPASSASPSGAPVGGAADVGEADVPRFSVDGATLPAQIRMLSEAVVETPGIARLERSLGLSELAQSSTRQSGVSRLGGAYIQRPQLANIGFDEDFSDLDANALRQMLVRAVEEANRAGSVQAWTAVAAIMTAEGRIDLALEKIAKARKAAADDGQRGALDELAKIVEGMRTGAKP